MLPLSKTINFLHTGLYQFVGGFIDIDLANQPGVLYRLHGSWMLQIDTGSGCNKVICDLEKQ